MHVKCYRCFRLIARLYEVKIFTISYKICLNVWFTNRNNHTWIIGNNITSPFKKAVQEMDEFGRLMRCRQDIIVHFSLLECLEEL